MALKPNDAETTGGAGLPFVLLLRGVNVGGHGKLPMADLRALLAGLGAQDVRTLIQSGNAAFVPPGPLAVDPTAFAGTVARAIEAAHGFRPACLVLPASALAAILAEAPADWAEEATHVWLPSAPLLPDRGRLATLAAPTERWRLTEAALWLEAPDGVGRSTFASGAERALGAPAAARRLTVLRRLLTLATG